MNELSGIGQIMKALELSKLAHVGVELTYFDVIELVGHIKSLEEDANLLRVDNQRLQSAYFVDETIAPDGELRPCMSKLVERCENLEVQLAFRDTLIERLIEVGNWLRHPDGGVALGALDSWISLEAGYRASKDGGAE